MINKARNLLAMATLLAFFAPLSQCTFNGLQPVEISAYSAYSWPSTEALIAALLFTWPSILLMSKRLGAKISARYTVLIETIFSLATSLGVAWVVCFGQAIRYGAFVVWFCMATYLLVVISDYKAGRKFADRGTQG